MKKSSPFLVLLLLGTACFCLATLLQPRAAAWSKRGESDNVLNVLLGDGRRLFANHFFVKADIYFHSGYYPSIFDRSAAAVEDSRHMTAQEGSPEERAHEKAMDFLGKPRDWVERFGRNFTISEHTHLEHGRQREILPWLRLSAELDPQRVDIYTVAAYWLCGLDPPKIKEAEAFLREGLRNNPNSFEILFELGRLENDRHHDPDRARNIWEQALRRWQQQEAAKKEPNYFAFEEITINLARLEEKAGHLAIAIDYMEAAKKISPNPAALQEQINELRAKLGEPGFF